MDKDRLTRQIDVSLEKMYQLGKANGAELCLLSMQAKYDALLASHKKLVDNLQRATDAIDVLAPEKFIGLVNIRNERLYNHRAAKQALSEAEKL